MSYLYSFLKYIFLPLFILLILLIIGDQLIAPIITKHGNELSLPNLVGKTQAEAEEILSKDDLKLQIRGKEYSPDKPEGIILTQLPKAGMKVKNGRVVKVVISAGVRVTEVPDVFALPLRQADIAIQRAGLIIGDMYWVIADTLPENVAVLTRPAAGTPLPLGSKVSLAINQGNRLGYVFVPELVSKPLNKARLILDSLGLYLSDISYVRDTMLLPNTVVDQSPRQNVQVQKGDSVRLILSETD